MTVKSTHNGNMQSETETHSKKSSFYRPISDTVEFLRNLMLLPFIQAKAKAFNHHSLHARLHSVRTHRHTQTLTVLRTVLFGG